MMFLKKMQSTTKPNVYRIQDFTKKDAIDETRFRKNQKGKLECNVIIFYEEDYNAMKEENTSLKSSVKKLEAQIQEAETKMQQLEEEYNIKTQDYIDSEASIKLKLEESIKEFSTTTNQAKEEHAKEILAIQEKHSREIIALNNKISKLKEDHQKELHNHDNANADTILDMEKRHHQELTSLKDEISSIKQKHNEELMDLMDSHNDEVTQIRNTFLKQASKLNNTYSGLASDLKSLSLFDIVFRSKHKDIIQEFEEVKRLDVESDVIDAYISTSEKEDE